MTLRAVIYARYSTDNQREASIEDQLEVCRRYIARQGWTLTTTYEDRAQSGASRFRPDFQRLLADAEARRFDVVVAEAIDRLGRKLADVADFFDRLTFYGVKLHVTNSGEVTPMHVGVMGMMAQMYLSDLRDKTLRGQLGRARAGRVPGGIAYGYAVVPGDASGAGARRINETEAAIVRRIFRDYAAGKSARTIAHELNAEAVPGPEGRPWGDTTIRGQLDRGTGILNNTLYIGELSWNRCSYVKDPRTGKRLARVNPREQWEVVAVPELRIIDQPLWDAVRARQQAARYAVCHDEGAGNALNRAHRREFLLSGVLVCGCCGGGYTIIGKDRYGCAARRSKGTCDNAVTITRQRLEARVLGGLREHMLTPALVAEFVTAFNESLAELQRDDAMRERRVKDALAAIERKLDAVVRAIEDGEWNDTLRRRLGTLEAEKASLTAELAALSKPAPPARLHPQAAEIYRRKVAALEQCLNEPDIRHEAGEALRQMIEKVVLTPDATAQDGLAAALHGDLAVILTQAMASERERRPLPNGAQTPPGTAVSGSLLSVVAGERCHLYRTHLRLPARPRNKTAIRPRKNGRLAAFPASVARPAG